MSTFKSTTLRFAPRHDVSNRDWLVLSYAGSSASLPWKRLRTPPGGELDRRVLERRVMLRDPLEQIRSRASEAAVNALGWLEQMAESFVVHFDVDVMDFTDFPVADVPQFNMGLSFTETMACLEVFASSPRFGGLVITELNPDHADEEGELARIFAGGVAHALR